MVVGGPADLSQQLRKGDDIKTVDGKRVDSEDVRERQPQPQIHGSLSIEWRCDVAVGRWQPFSVDPTSPDRLCCLRSNEQARYTTNRADVSGVPPPQLPLQGEWRCLILAAICMHAHCAMLGADACLGQPGLVKVQLKRMATEKIADRRKLFEVKTAILPPSVVFQARY
eukprot:1823028-Rhodomonas_salina.1